MTNPAASILPFLLLLLLFLPALATAHHDSPLPHLHLIHTPTGHRVPAHRVRALLSLPSAAPVQHLIYKVHESGDLHCADSALNTSLSIVRLSGSPSFSTPLRSPHPLAAAQSTLNGRRTSFSFAGLRERHGDVDAVFSTQRTLLAAWASGLTLLPLDVAEHPGVFVNVHRSGDAGGIPVSLPFTGEGEHDGISAPPSSNGGRGRSPADTIGQCVDGAAHVMEAFAVVDNTFCALFANDSSAIAAVLQSSFDIANEPFTTSTCVSLALVGVEAHCNDPADPFVPVQGRDATGLLTKLRGTFIAQRGAVRRDTAVLFTGYGGGRFIGVAFRPGTCDDLGYAWVERVNPYTLAHEIGHNLDMYHFAQGLMGTEGQSRRDFWFAPESVANLTRFIDAGSPGLARDISCLKESANSCDESCPNAPCEDGLCVVNTPPSQGAVPCVVAEVFDCAVVTPIVNSSTLVFYTRADCPRGFPYARRTYDANDPTIRCCAPVADVSDVVTTLAVDTQLSYVDEEAPYQGVIYNDVIVLARNATYSIIEFINTTEVPCNAVSPSPSTSLSPTISSSPSSSTSSSPSPSSASPSASQSALLPSTSPSPSALQSQSSSSSPFLSVSSSLTPSSSPSATLSSTFSQSATLSTSPSASLLAPQSASSTPLSTTSPSSSSSASFSVSPTFSSPASPSFLSSPPPAMCGDQFTAARHLSCATLRRRTLPLSLSLSTGANASVSLTLRVRYGRVFYVTRVSRPLRIAGVGVFASTSKTGLRRSEVTLTPVEGTRRKVDGLVDPPVSLMQLQPGRTTCCGRRGVFAFVRVRACEGEECAGAYKRVAVKLKCRPLQVCEEEADGREEVRAVPMSDDDRCPVCPSVPAA